MSSVKLNCKITNCFFFLLQAFWCLKLQCLTQQIYVDELESDEDGIADVALSEDAIAQTARPGTSLKTAGMATSSSQSIRPVTQSGRPITGVIRPGTQSNMDSLETALKTARTAKTARPMTSSSGRFVRLGTASMLSSGPGGPFINLARLNLSNYATNVTLSKPLFEYILMHENDIRTASDLAQQALKHTSNKDWWWKLQLGKCCYKLGLLREAEEHLKSCIGDPGTNVDPFLWLGKVYLKMDQPLSSIEIYKAGVDKFPEELTVALARVKEALNQMDEAVKLYREVLLIDPVCIEAIACIATHHFYTDQPEVALRYYRRILQINISSCEVYNNLGLCCYYSQQYDLTISCFERALMFSDSDETTADIWYNISHVALGSGDIDLASQCLHLAIFANNNHAEAYNNLGVLEANKAANKQSSSSHVQARSFFESATNNGSHLYEPFYNLALLEEERGNYQIAYEKVKKALSIYPSFYGAKELFKRLRKMYESI